MAGGLASSLRRLASWFEHTETFSATDKLSLLVLLHKTKLQDYKDD